MNTDWKKLERHPLSADHDDIVGTTWESLKNGLREHGILNQRKIILHEGKVLDGWQLHRACVELDIHPYFDTLPEGIPPARFVEIVNLNRRHEDTEASQRRRRATEKRLAGLSIRTIAKEEGVSRAQIDRDLAKTQTVGPGGGTTGTDGKFYPPKQPQVYAPDIHEEIPDFDEPVGTTPEVNGKPKKSGNTSSKKKASSEKAPESSEIDANDEMVDDAGFSVPGRLRKAFACKALFRSIAAKLSAVGTMVNEAVLTDAYLAMKTTLPERFRHDVVIRGSARAFRDIEPSLLHQACNSAGCPACGDKGYLTLGEIKDEKVPA